MAFKISAWSNYPLANMTFRDPNLMTFDEWRDFLHLFLFGKNRREATRLLMVNDDKPDPNFRELFLMKPEDTLGFEQCRKLRADFNRLRPGLRKRLYAWLRMLGHEYERKYSSAFVDEWMWLFTTMTICSALATQQGYIKYEKD